MLAHLKYFLCAFAVVAVAPLYLAVWIFSQFLFKICKREMAFIFDEVLYASYQRFILFFMEIITDTRVILYGDHVDALSKRESIILFSNHQCAMDWVVVSMLAERAGMPGAVKFVLKQSLKFIPLYGFYFKQHGYVYVERSGKFKKDKFQEQLEQLSQYPRPIWLTLFPEGHRYNPEKTTSLEKMKQYAKDNDLPTYAHLLTPRTKAFSVCMEKLNKKVEAIYDMTFAFSCTLPPLESEEASPRYAPPSYFRLFREKVDIHLHISRIPVSQVPVGGDDFDKWLYSRYSSKDKLLSDFYSKDSSSRGTFGPGGVTSGISLSSTVLTAGIYFACLLPWLSSLFMFEAYLLMSLVLGAISVTVSSFCY